MTRRSQLALIGFLALAAAALGAQQTTRLSPGQAGSPHDRTDWTLRGAHISITYGRPFLKGRTIGSKDFVPYDTEWRTGADEATTLVTDRPLKFGALEVPAGTYTLYTLPGAKAWQWIVSRKTGQWGIPYPAGEDLGRAPMQLARTAAPVEQLTISIDPTPQGGVLRVEFGSVSARIAFTVG